MHTLPKPSKEALLHSQRLCAHITADIRESGPIPFSRYMQLALYEPGLGYYSAGATKFGEAGDFVTAPHLTHLFGAAIAHYIKARLEPSMDLFEFGAGTGKLAADIMSTLDQLGKLPNTYYILEVSADLRDRQKAYLQSHCPALFGRFVWLDRLPAQPIAAIVVANEVLDAMPVSIFKQDEGLREVYVDVNGADFIAITREASTPLKSAVSALAQEFPHGYSSEVNLNVKPWLEAIYASISRGHCLFIDYGYLEADYYSQARTTGTLMCHYRHQAHYDPFFCPGLQDITAHVDFSHVMSAGEDVGFQVESFQAQADFLLDNEVLSFLSEIPADSEPYRQATEAVKRLMLPTEMGQMFKVLSLEKVVS